jgi:hypothetical protein
VATWKANAPIPASVAPAIEAFIAELNENPDLELTDQGLTDGKTKLSRAYYAFCEVHKQHT